MREDSTPGSDCIEKRRMQASVLAEWEGKPFQGNYLNRVSTSGDSWGEDGQEGVSKQSQ